MMLTLNVQVNSFVLDQTTQSARGVIKLHNNLL